VLYRPVYVDEEKFKAYHVYTSGIKKAKKLTQGTYLGE